MTTATATATATAAATASTAAGTSPATGAEGTSRLSARDRDLFKGTAAEVHPWMSTSEILGAIGCNFDVESHAPTVNGRVYNESRLWLRSDNGDHLGTFGNRRKVIQPGDFVTYFRDFCEKSDKAISLDLVGTPDKGKTFYMASKLIDSNLQRLMDDNKGRGFQIKQDLDKRERTDVWLIITDYYGESAAPKAIVLFNELACYNGMTYKSESKLAGLTHLKQQGSEHVAQSILDALQQVQVYQHVKDRLIETPVTRDFAVSVINRFYRPEGQDPNESNRKAERILDIYGNRLIGGNLPTRQGTAWGLLQAVTQSTTYEHIGDGAASGGRAFRSILDGPRASEARRFAAHLENCLAAV
jgi:hypothetical protein